MSGVFPLVRLMFTALPVQRCFLRIGTLLAFVSAAAVISGAHGSASWWAPVAIIGSFFFLGTFPWRVSAVLLRHLAASRAIRLIPRGRLQLLLGSFVAQLLLASVGAAAMSALANFVHLQERLPAGALTAYGALAGTSVIAFAAATVAFLTVYYASAYQLSSLILLAYLIMLRVLSVVFPHWPVREFLASPPALGLAFIGTLGLWALFAIAFLSAGRITPPAWSQMDGALMEWLTGRDGHTVTAQSGQSAARILLTGKYFRHRITRSLAGIGAALLYGYYLWTFQGNPALKAGEERLLAVLTAYVGGIAAAAATYPMVGRARYLWLKVRLDRDQLFRAVEAESWRTLVSIAAFALTLCAYLCHMAQVPWASIFRILLLSFVSGAAMIYLVLLNTRGWRLLEGVLVAALSALWLVGLIQGAFAAAGGHVLLLLAPGLLLVPLLRSWAKSRWSRIDWLVNRPAKIH